MAVLTLALLLPWLGAAPFDDPGEGQHAEIAREVAVSGDWLTLRLAGVRYFDKPPLLYWLIAAGFKGFGVSEWAGRLPAVKTPGDQFRVRSEDVAAFCVLVITLFISTEGNSTTEEVDCHPLNRAHVNECVPRLRFEQV